jgi:hypothetical protein
MSYFVEQNHTVCDFSNSNSWVILSPIEQSIKRKIETIGTPLKDWDIQINYGIKTGYNDAFIIDTAKRDEILANCVNADEYKRTEELIRPILRGRDIKRYGYDWANLYLIATFPSKHYNIENYPAIKKYLLSFAREELIDTGNKWVADEYLEDYCKQKLSQTGMFVSINGQHITLNATPEIARKKTGNKWFETQDSINYWEDFNKPKILWKRIGSKLRFSFDDNSIMGLDSTCFAIGLHIPYLCCILNSKMGNYLLKDSPKTGTGDLLISVQAVEPLKIPINHQYEIILSKLLSKQISNYKEDIDNHINDIVFKLYQLSESEIQFVEDMIIGFR